MYLSHFANKMQQTHATFVSVTKAIYGDLP